MILGIYTVSNQPMQHMTYLYNDSGEPWEAQLRVREVMVKLYSAAPDGYCGDEDNGQTSAWYVFSALGFYPVCPGTDEYVIGSPLFKKVTVDTGRGNKFTITAGNNSTANRYVESVDVNGRAYTKNYLTHSDLTKGAKVDFVMSPAPNTSRGTSPEDFPYSFSRSR